MSTAADSPAPSDPDAPRRLTRAERSAKNKAAWKDLRSAPLPPLAPPPVRPVPEPAPTDDGAFAHVASTPRVGPDGSALPPETHAKLEARALVIYRQLLDRLEGIANNPRSTHNDIIGAAGHLRLASSIGRSDPAPVRYILPMASLLGGDAPDQVAPPVADEDGESDADGEDGSAP